MSHAMSLCFMLQCATCEGWLSTPSARAVLAGCVRYAVCPACGREVPEEGWTPAYRQRWDAKVRELSGLPREAPVAVEAGVYPKPRLRSFSPADRAQYAEDLAAWRAALAS